MNRWASRQGEPGWKSTFRQAQNTSRSGSQRMRLPGSEASSPSIPAGSQAEAGVGEYWVVLAKERAIEVFRQPEGLAYREVRRDEFADELLCSTVPGVKVVLAELFAGISA